MTNYFLSVRRISLIEKPASVTMSKDAQAVISLAHPSLNQLQQGESQASYQPSTTTTLAPDVESKAVPTSNTSSLKADIFSNDAKNDKNGEDIDGENDTFRMSGESGVGIPDEKEAQTPSHHSGPEIKVSQRKKWGLLALFSVSLVIDRESDHKVYSRQLSN